MDLYLLSKDQGLDQGCHHPCNEHIAEQFGVGSLLNAFKSPELLPRNVKNLFRLLESLAIASNNKEACFRRQPEEYFPEPGSEENVFLHF